MLAETKVPVMEKAVKVILDMSEDTKIREMAKQREKMLHDEASLIQGARNEGKNEGIEQTILKSIFNLMDSLNVTDKEAMNILKLSKEEQIKYSKILSK